MIYQEWGSACLRGGGRRTPWQDGTLNWERLNERGRGVEQQCCHLQFS